jgi:FkbM family methyltransferase
MLRANGFTPRVAIDAGAYHGEWTDLCKEIWPQSSVLMLEGNPERAAVLKRSLSRWHGVSAEQVLLGPASEAAVPFYEQEAASSVLPETAKENQPFIMLPMRALDDVTAGTIFRKPDLIKLDVQGYELDSLKGGRLTLESAEVVLTEVNFIPIYDGAPLVREVMEFFADAGFRAYDIATFYRRPLDGALWQTDMFFVRYESPLIASVRYE